MLKVIEIEEDNLLYLENLFIKHELTHRSAILKVSLPLLEKRTFQDILSDIEKTIISLRKSPLFPDPLYLLSHQYIESKYVRVISNVKDISPHFKRISKLKSNQKIDILKHQISSLNIGPFLKRMQKIEQSKQRELMEIIDILHFYYSIFPNNRNKTDGNDHWV